MGGQLRVSPTRLRGLLVGLASLLVSFSADAADCPIATPEGYQAVASRLHSWTGPKQPLAGRIWAHGHLLADAADPETGCARPAPLALVQDLSAKLAKGGIVLLGEIHDDQNHHDLRAEMIALLAASRTPPAVVMEQIRVDQQPALDRFAAFDASAARRGVTGDLLRFLDWDTSPWSKTADYKPLFSAVVEAHLALYPGDPARDAIHAVAKDGLAALDTADRTRLALDDPLGSAQDAASLAEIDASHCGMIPKSAQPGMALAQRYRDAHMADALLRAASAHGSAVLIAGNGHVRSDRGVPWYLRRRAPERPVTAVALIEVEDGAHDAEAAIPRGPDGSPAADVVIFTPASTREGDPCAGMKAPRDKK